MKSRFLCIALAVASVVSATDVIDLKQDADFLQETPSCKQTFHGAAIFPQCATTSCARRVTDGLFSDADISTLHNIVNKGMSQRPALGGPTILDINTGNMAYLL